MIFFEINKLNIIVIIVIIIKKKCQQGSLIELTIMEACAMLAAWKPLNGNNNANCLTPN